MHALSIIIMMMKVGPRIKVAYIKRVVSTSVVRKETVNEVHIILYVLLFFMCM